KLLLKIHKDDSFLNDILRLIAGYTQADQVSIFEFTPEGYATVTYEYCSPGVQAYTAPNEVFQPSQVPFWMELLQKNEIIQIDQLDSIRQDQPNEYQMLKAQRIEKLYLAPIISSYQTSGNLVAFLRVNNPQSPYNNIHFMEHLAFGLSIAYDNYQEFYQIQKLSTYDLATNVLNRNQYIHYVQHFSAEGIRQLACIYADVNGLHEYNNQFGHIKGDEMLSRVARLLNQHFREEKVFRAGGDEFVIIAENKTEESLKRAIEAFEAELKQSDVSVALGMEYRSEGFNIEEMLKAADTNMYDNKFRYYSEKQN
ncbi:MAG: sensor domain-containing diguanylate cyclase, partial [Candidatus Riflebacteria bacterium]|nr:sensor domain-containing diguanylate cyclase [Candidatus Riflebacteria bacterium]